MDEPRWNHIKKSSCIAITGGIATGKSTICRYLLQKGYLVIDADQLSRQAVAKGTQGFKRVVALFGSSVLDASGDLDRRALGQIVFHSIEKRQALEAIIHPELNHLALSCYEQANVQSKRSLWFYEASLIFEKNLQNQFLSVWLADCSPELQLQRLRRRDHMSDQEAQERINSQMAQAAKRPLADRIIDTGQSIEAVYESIDLLIQESLLD